MNLVNVGNFIKELRKEKNITQEELSEKFYVSRRTVSRWETGSNLPDIDVLIELADYFNVDLREILNGKRKDNNMNYEEQELSKDVSEYTKARLKRTSIITLVLLIFSMTMVVIGFIFEFIDIPYDHINGFIRGVTYGSSFATMIIAILYITGIFDKFAMAKYNHMHNK